MSETLAVAATNVRILLRDRTPANYAVDTPLELFHAIVERAQALSLEAGLGRTVTATAFASVAGSAADIQITSLYYGGIFAVRDELYGTVLQPMTMADLMALREGTIATSPAQGIPQAYAIYESAAGATLIRFDCVPNAAQNYTVENEALITTSYTAGKVLSFSDNFLRVIEKATALELAQKLPADVLERNRLSPRVTEQWARDVAAGIRAEKQRKFNTTGAPFGTEVGAW